MAIFRRGPPLGGPLTGASNAGEVGKNRDSRRISGYQWMAAAVQTTTATVHRAVRHASVILFIAASMDDLDEEKRE